MPYVHQTIQNMKVEVRKLKRRLQEDLTLFKAEKDWIENRIALLESRLGEVVSLERSEVRQEFFHRIEEEKKQSQEKASEALDELQNLLQSKPEEDKQQLQQLQQQQLEAARELTQKSQTVEEWQDEISATKAEEALNEIAKQLKE